MHDFIPSSSRSRSLAHALSLAFPPSPSLSLSLSLSHSIRKRSKFVKIRTVYNVMIDEIYQTCYSAITLKAGISTRESENI